MSDFTIYHNPRCSKSRQTLDLLEQHNIQPEIVLYLENPPTAAELAAILRKLDVRAEDLLRKGEEIYKNLELKSIADQMALIDAMAEHPKLIERPIVVKGNKAVLGRPPENVLELIG